MIQFFNCQLDTLDVLLKVYNANMPNEDNEFPIYDIRVHYKATLKTYEYMIQREAVNPV